MCISEYRCFNLYYFYLILDQLDEDKIIIDPIVKNARPSDSCKAYQMLRLSQDNLPVPRSIYGDLDFLKNKAIKEFEIDFDERYIFKPVL